MKYRRFKPLSAPVTLCRPPLWFRLPLAVGAILASLLPSLWANLAVERLAVKYQNDWLLDFFDMDECRVA